MSLPVQTVPLKDVPWYVQPWPWLLMAGPATVVVASAATLWLALASNDGLVSDDYYKEGLAVNQVLLRDTAARTLALRARVVVSANSNHVFVSLNRMLPSAQLVLRAVHPTRPGLDLELPLAARGGSEYEAAFPQLPAGRWLMVLEDRARSWRISGDLCLPAESEAELSPR